MITLEYGNKSREIKVLEPLHENEMDSMEMYGKNMKNELQRMYSLACTVFVILPCYRIE